MTTSLYHDMYFSSISAMEGEGTITCSMCNRLIVIRFDDDGEPLWASMEVHIEGPPDERHRIFFQSESIEV